MSLPTTLAAHLTDRIGALPGRRPMQVVASPRAGLPGWDGRPPLLDGLVDPSGHGVVGVPPAVLGPGRIRDLAQLPALVGAPDRGVERVVLRWCTRPAPLPDVGSWFDAGHPALPGWLRPFGGEALVVLDDRGRYLAGVGIKRHDELAHEIAVGTEPAARGRGLARRLVAQAARRIVDEGRVPTYLHTLDNAASSQVAAAAGFPDLGWSALMLTERPADAAA